MRLCERALVAAVLVSGLLAAVPIARADGILLNSYSASITFADASGGNTPMPLAFDGTHYWAASGGTTAAPYTEYDSTGALIQTFHPGLDFRSVFTGTSGQVFARPFANSTIYQQTSPGVFAASGVTLTGGNLNDQSAVVLDQGTTYVAQLDGAVDRWGLNGAFLGSVQLQGFGAIVGETDFPNSVGFASAGNYWLTYDATTEKLSAWDHAGNRVGTTQLLVPGAPPSSFAAFSLSYANGMVFVDDGSGGSWRGYNLGLAAPPPATAWAGLVLLLAAGAWSAVTARRARAR